ncbi:MAG: amidohydrolase family protein [Desulfarculus sp.]|nr:amidohydrolase family protein [Desulfarculus sp.]
MTTLADLKRRAGGLPFCMHVAESQAEVEFMLGEGPEGKRLEEFLLARKLERASLGLKGLRPLAHLMDLGLLDQRTMLVHGVQLTRQEVRDLAGSGASLCVCPRSNLGLTGGLAPVADLLAAGVNLALGTDSRASCPSLSLWEEMAALGAAVPGLAPQDILHLATAGGATALGLAGHFGRLAPGLAGPLAFAPRERLGKGQVLEAVVNGGHAGPPRPVGRVHSPA